MKQVIVYVGIPLFIVFGHIAIMPFIFFPEFFLLEQRIDVSDQINIALLVAPLTSASFVSIVIFAVENRQKKISELPLIANMFFPLLSATVIFAFFASIFIFLLSFQSTGGKDIEVLKGFIGVIEIFLGSAFAIIVNGTFSKQA